MTDQLPIHVFDADRAKRYDANPAFTKTAVLVDVIDPSAVTVLNTPFGEQRLLGSFYAIAEGAMSYGAARSEFDQAHVQVRPNEWAKNESIEAYQADERCDVETYVGSHHEGTVTANVGDWIVRQRSGEVMVVRPAEFEERYTAASPPPKNSQRK